MAASRCALVVEDDANIRRLVEIVLRRHCESVDTTGDGKTAIEQLGATDYDLVVLDIMVPNANGFEIAEFIEKMSKPPRIIVLSAISRYFPDRFPEGTIVLQKPFDLDRLEEAVKSVI
jgi:DNA-binding response OmpR family regulator